MVMVKRRHELDFGCSRWFCFIPLWYSSNISAFTLPQDLCSYGGVFIIMALVWGWIFERIVPDLYDILGAVIALVENQ